MARLSDLADLLGLFVVSSAVDLIAVCSTGYLDGRDEMSAHGLGQLRQRAGRERRLTHLLELAGSGAGAAPQAAEETQKLLGPSQHPRPLETSPINPTKRKRAPG